MSFGPPPPTRRSLLGGSINVSHKSLAHAQICWPAFVMQGTFNLRRCRVLQLLRASKKNIDSLKASTTTGLVIPAFRRVLDYVVVYLLFACFWIYFIFASQQLHEYLWPLGRRLKSSTTIRLSPLLYDVLRSPRGKRKQKLHL